MKKTLITLMLSALTLTGFSQSTELTARLNSGLFYFSGESVESTEQINYNLESERGYTNNPYGNRPAISYGISANISRITKSNFKLGIDIGYEILRSKIEINRVSLWDGINATSEEVDGQTFINNSFINIFPSLGYRKSIKSINLDFDIGLEIAKCLTSAEKGEAKSSTRTYETDVDRKTIETDIRGRFQLTVSKNKIGGYVGYSNGIKNYKEGFVGGTNLAFSRMIRLGLIYKLK
jgi:hypothetical protein